MTAETFEKSIRNIKLPVGTLLEDGCTYLLEDEELHNCPYLDPEFKKFERFLVLSDGSGTVVGGVLFYGYIDFQILTLSEYRGKGYMSAIHKNGILKRFLYPKQEVTIDTWHIESKEDLESKEYMLSLIGLQAKNKKDLEWYKEAFLQHA